MIKLKKNNVKKIDKFKQNKSDNRIQIYGIHAVKAALEQSTTQNATLYLTANAKRKLSATLQNTHSIEIIDCIPKKLTQILGAQAVHQGVLLYTKRPPKMELQDVLNSQLILLLDQITDPHNAGAILRTANVFGVDAVIAPHRNISAQNSFFIKATSGAYIYTPFITVVNLGKTIEQLKERDFLCIGLSEEAQDDIHKITLPQEKRLAVIVGAEGKGIRPSIKQRCDVLVKIKSYGDIQTLNASCATSIALHSIKNKSLGNE